MAGKDVAVIEAAEIVVDQPLSEKQARQLDDRIRKACVRVSNESNKLLDLLEEAAKGQIHVALGYPSWTAYIKDAVHIAPSSDTERKALVSLMSGKGMSVRAIAEVVGVGKSTVSRDLEDADVPDGTPTTGVDGKTYERKAKDKDAEVIDAEVVEEPEPKPQPVSKDFADEMVYLYNSVSNFKEILEDERFPKARKAIAKKHLNTLQEYIGVLQAVVDALMDGE